jgi:hypothetical protein
MVVTLNDSQKGNPFGLVEPWEHAQKAKNIIAVFACTHAFG